MSTVGVYGIMTDAVQRKTREIGLRLALGARPAQIARLVIVEAAYPAAWRTCGRQRRDPGRDCASRKCSSMASLLSTAEVWRCRPPR